MPEWLPCVIMVSTFIVCWPVAGSLTLKYSTKSTISISTEPLGDVQVKTGASDASSPSAMGMVINLATPTGGDNAPSLLDQQCICMGVARFLPGGRHLLSRRA